MKEVTPKVLLIAETHSHPCQLDEMVQHLGGEGFNTDAPTGSEAVIEASGRLCYKSFEAGLNLNVKKVREGNKTYINNILKHHHGSVLEHGSVTFALLDVSRVVTHELVRHRAGCAYSQESLRYVRLTDISAYYPEAFKAINLPDPEDAEKLEVRFRAVIEECEAFQFLAAKLLDIDNLGMDQKKKLTSAMRRAAPIGLATNLIMTANHRAWRHIIGLRTGPHAEEEVRLVVGMIANQLKEKFPSLYQDMELTFDGSWVFQHEKV